MTTHAFTNASANFSAQSERGRKTPSASQDATACRNMPPADSARVITRNCVPCRDCGHQLHLSLVVARACPPPGFPVIITTCVGLRKRRARGRILLASNPAKACCSPLSLSTAASRNCGHDRFMGLAILAPHRNIYAFRYERKRKMHSQPPPRSPPKVPAPTPCTFQASCPHAPGACMHPTPP